MPGPTEIVVIIIVALVLFGGATAIPKLARSLGRAKKEFEAGVKESAEDKSAEDKNKDQKS